MAIGLGTVVFAWWTASCSSRCRTRIHDELSVLRGEAGAFPRQDCRRSPGGRIEGMDGRHSLSWPGLQSVRESPITRGTVSPTRWPTVDERFFQVLAHRPPLGGFVQADFDQTLRSVRPVLISHRLWRRALGGDPGVVGRTVGRVGTRESSLRRSHCRCASGGISSIRSTRGARATGFPDADRDAKSARESSRVPCDSAAAGVGGLERRPGPPGDRQPEIWLERNVPESAHGDGPGWPHLRQGDAGSDRPVTW